MSALLAAPSPSPRTGGLSLEVATAPTAIDAVSDEWRNLLRLHSQRNLFLTAAWTRAWWHAFGEGGRLRLLMLRDGGRLVALAVYRLYEVRLRGLPVRVLGTFSNAHTSRNDLVVVPGYEADAAARIARWFADCAAEWDVAWLQQLPAGNLWSDCFLGAAHDEGLLPSEVAEGVAKCRMPLDRRSWDDYVEQRGSHFRRSIGKTARRVERGGQVVYRHSLNPRQADTDFETFAQVEARSWKDDTESAAHLGAKGWRFQQAFATAYDEGISCDNWIVELDGTPVAVVHSVGFERVSYCFQTLFDERVRDLYIGRAAVTRHFEHVFDSGLYDVLDFNGDSEFCRSWGPVEARHLSLQLHHRRPFSRLLWSANRLRGRA